MRDDNYPHPVSDPEAEGLPEYSDDDSTARDDVETGRQADGPDPAALPADAPLAVDRYGTTPEEQLVGEDLDSKLGREVPDPALRAGPAPRPDTVPSPISAEAFDATPGTEISDVLDEDTALDDPDLSGVGEASTTDPHTDSAVSVYDRPEWDTGPGGTVGRIVEPDEGFGEDDEKDAIGYDAGAAGGGASAEELAMHEVPER